MTMKNSLMERARNLQGQNRVPAGFVVPPPPTPESLRRPVGNNEPTKTIEAALGGVIQNPAFDVAERQARVEPNDGWYDPIRSPQSPTQFEILNWTVPKGKAIVVLEFNFEPYIFNGVSGAASPCDENDLNGILGFSFQVNGNVPGMVDFVLEPTPSNYQRDQFRPVKTKLVPPDQRVQADFQRTAATAYAAAAGFGTGLLPQRRGTFGSDLAPRGFVAFEDQRITMTGVIYRQMPIPLAFIQAGFKGYSSPHTMLRKLIADQMSAQ